MSRRAAFGLELVCDFPLPGTWSEPDGEDRPAVRILLSADAAVEDPAATPEWQTTFPDGQAVVVERGSDDSYRFRYGTLARYVLSPARDVITVAPSDPDDPRWRRFLLDTVLWWTSLAHGYHVLHASAVEGPHGVAIFAGRTGGGKTTLALEFLRRGWRLFSDDIVALDPPAGRPVVHPGPPLMNAPLTEPDLERFGTPIAELNGESWLSIQHPGSASQPLAAVFLYSRGEGRELELEPARATVLDLVPHVWDIHLNRDRLRSRFELLTRIVEQVPVYHLSAHSTTPPVQIVDLVADQLLEGSQRQ